MPEPSITALDKALASLSPFVRDECKRIAGLIVDPLCDAMARGEASAPIIAAYAMEKLRAATYQLNSKGINASHDSQHG